MRRNSRLAALTVLLLVVIFVGQALPQEKIIGKALYEKLQREGRRWDGRPGRLPSDARRQGSYAFEDGTFKTDRHPHRRKDASLRRGQASGRGQRHDRTPGGQASSTASSTSTRRRSSSRRFNKVSL